MKHLNFTLFLLILLSFSCGGGMNNYVRPELEDLTSDSIYWMKLNEGQLSGEYFFHKGEVYCGEVMYNSYPMKGVDTETFEVLNGTDYARDKNKVFYPLMSICVDGQNWGNCHAVEYVVNGADAASFNSVGDGYGVDKHSVYHRGEIMLGVHSDEFENLSQGYARDSNHVYCFGKVLEEADRETFVVLEFGRAEDSLNSYDHGRLQEK